MSDNEKIRVNVESIKDELVIDVIKERQGERRWRWIRRIGLGGFFVLTLGVTAANMAREGGLMPSGDKVAVIPLHGEIQSGAKASAEKLVPALRKAFENDQVKAVVIDIDSPGGQPQEAERIYRELDRLKQKHKKPVVAVISAQGASAAYLVAIHTDKIIAGNYSMVGSIGAVIQTWDFSKIAGKVGVGRNTVASGQFKDLLNPFREMSPDDREKVHQLVKSMADKFIGEVTEKRKHDKDFVNRNQDIFTGEVWSGEEAMKLGLVDSIGTLEEVTQSYGMKVAEIVPAKSSGGLFSMFSLESALDAVAVRMTEQLTGKGLELR